jgi:hypothetical protein
MNHLLPFAGKVLNVRDVVAIGNYYGRGAIVHSHYLLHIGHRFIGDEANIREGIAKFGIQMIVIRLFEI